MWHLVTEGQVDLSELIEGIEQKWDFRGRSFTNVRDEFAAKEPRYRRLWETRLSEQMVDLPEFDDVFRSVRRALRQAGLIPR